MKDKKKYLMFAVGLVITAYFLWQSTRQVKLHEFLGDLKKFQAWSLIPATLIFYYSMYLRAVRWGLLFRPHHKLTGFEVFRPMMLCFGFNCVLPGRVGEFARAWVVGTRNKTGLPTALATVVAERIIDASTLIALLACSLMVLPKVDPALSVKVWDYSVSGADFNAAKAKIVVLSLVLVAGVMIFMIPMVQRVMHLVIDALPLRAGLRLLALLLFPFRGLSTRIQSQLDPMTANLSKNLHHILNHFAQGFHALQQPWVLAQILFHSIVLWVLIGVSNMMIAWGFGMKMNLAQAEAQMVITAIFIILPAAPGYWGLFEAGIIFSSLVLRIVTASEQSLALAYALVVHLVQYVPLVVMGLIFAWQLQMKPTALAAIETETADHQAPAKSR